MHAPDQKLIRMKLKKTNQFFESIFQDRVLDSPEFQTRLGYKSNYDQWMILRGLVEEK